MANIKKLTEVAEIASVGENTKVFVNDNDSLKQVPTNAIGAQADWNVEDATSPAYVKNKPDLNSVGVQADWNETDNTSPAFIVNKPDLSQGGASVAFYWDSSNGYLYKGTNTGSNWAYQLTQADIINDFSNGVIRLNGSGTVLSYSYNTNGTKLYYVDKATAVATNAYLNI